MTTVTTMLLLFGLIAAGVRLVIGPTTADRVIALDLLSTIGVGVLALVAVVRREPVLLDVAVGLALVAFVGTVAIATYLERRVS